MIFIPTSIGNLRIKLTTPGTKFRWTDDPTNAGMGTIYTVVNAEEFFVRNYILF